MYFRMMSNSRFTSSCSHPYYNSNSHTSKNKLHESHHVFPAQESFNNFTFERLPVDSDWELDVSFPVKKTNKKTRKSDKNHQNKGRWRNLQPKNKDSFSERNLYPKKSTPAEWSLSSNKNPYYSSTSSKWDSLISEKPQEKKMSDSFFEKLKLDEPEETSGKYYYKLSEEKECPFLNSKFKNNCLKKSFSEKSKIESQPFSSNDLLNEFDNKKEKNSNVKIDEFIISTKTSKRKITTKTYMSKNKIITLTINEKLTDDF
jgi:hypothetical protein